MIFILAILIMVLVIVIGNSENNEKKAMLEKIQADAGNALVYNPKTETITVNERRHDNKQRFSFENYKRKAYSYTEEKLIYSSATVGGITTGGFDTVGGTSKKDVATNKYRLVYEYVEDNIKKNGYVKKIRLSKKIASQIEESPIKEFYTGKHIAVETPISEDWEKKKTQFAIRYNIAGSDYTLAAYSNAEENEIVKTLPTFQKCTQIVEWISDDAYPQ